MNALELRGEDLCIYLASKVNLKGLNVSLDAATREYADAKRISKNADLREVARFRQKYAKDGPKRVKVPDLTEKTISDLKADGRIDYHLRDLNRRLGRFAEEFSGEIGHVSEPQIDGWLRSLRSLAKRKKDQAIAGKTRNNYQNAGHWAGDPPYRGKTETGSADWRCEYWGKWFASLALADAWRLTPATRKKCEAAVDALMATAAPDGYLGTRQREHRLEGWDVWGCKYVLPG